ncbi:MAG: DUF192 domain-containing protein [Actinomycetota bacterium]
MSYWVQGLGIALSLLLSGCSLGAFPLKAETATVVQAQQHLGQRLPIAAEATIAGQAIQLEVAKTPEQQAMGLMYRTSLPDNQGMLFAFTPARPVRFWMKNCQMSLDMIFVRGGVVQAVAANTPPCQAEPCPTYGPNVTVDQVIELRGGRAAELGVKAGDRIAIRWLEFPPAQPAP